MESRLLSRSGRCELLSEVRLSPTRFFFVFADRPDITVMVDWA